MQKHDFSTPVQFYFSRVKDIHIEEGKAYITLFARLSRKTPESTESVWVSIEEIAWNQADRRLQKMPNGVYTYQLPEGVFHELERLGRDHMMKLYFLTPMYQTVTFKPLGN